MFISPLSAQPATPIEVPPPDWFRPPCGPVRHAYINYQILLPEQRGNSAAKHNGILYERKAQHHIKETIGGLYMSSPRVNFEDDRGSRFCIPDGLFEDTLNHRIFIFEIKIRHMPEAWWQLKRLYEPVIRAARKSNFKIYCIEVVKEFDPTTPFPCEFTLISDLRHYVEVPQSAFGVYPWSK